MRKACPLLAFFILFQMMFPSVGYADTNRIMQTKTKLQQLDTKIGVLKQHLSQTENKHITLQHALKHTEKEISYGVQQLHALQQTIDKKEDKIARLQQRITALKHTFKKEQQLLATHLQARYAMGDHQPFKWLLNQDNLVATQRILMFYQYIIRAHQTLLQELNKIQTQLAKTQTDLQQRLLAQQELRQQLQQRQKTLQANKYTQNTILQSLAKEIRTQQQMLEEYQRNKNNLSHLLRSLDEQSQPSLFTPMRYLRRRLPRPVNVSNAHLKRIHQGILFFTAEGEPVHAVYAGKVVFSDWLKGYGLLLIIDHGQGFMSLYAHNQSLFKQKGDAVNQGEQIATTGHSGGLKQNGLYFEIRQRGKAVSPLQWLA